MPKIQPFKAIRAPRAFANLVASRSYEDYSDGELESKLEFNPYTFLHVINPGYRYHKEVTGVQRFQLVKNRYLEFKEDGIYVKDKDPALYVYRMTTRNNSFCGIIAGASADDYAQDKIKKHEDTMQRREELFKDYLKTVGFNAEPVLLTYPDKATIKETIDKVTAVIPDYEFTTQDRVTHALWPITDIDIISILQYEFEQIPNFYIADGHHRTASSYLLAETLKAENPDHTGKEAYNFFMSFLIPESELRIYEFNRMVKDLNGLSKEQFLFKLDKWFRIENRGLELYKPSKKHHFSMYLDGEYYSLYLRKTVYKFTDALSELDTQILYKTILEPILGISDLKNDRRIKYGYGKNNLLQMKQQIDEGDFAVGFGMMPLSVEEIKAIADEGLTMPPKSTYIEPKMRSGLTIYEF
ncbi:DUF1015 domain-containing protein [Sungkyunkwania multivorans]|uniref:DUF1015 domain-containing protein n=1 Tax=Sungkyunkwania multivorans TaxID=1173618 RepID=A0ABW3CYB6_9FLAO